MELEKFYGKITKYGDSSYVLIPAKLMKFTGLNINDDVEIYIKKK